MDAIFHLGDSDRAAFLTSLMHSFGCSYICLWFHVSPQNYLQSKDGYYHEDLSEQQASSSSGSLASRLYDEYRMQTVFIVENDVVPGLAFKQRSPCIVLNGLEVNQLASTNVQRQFYLEARIKTAVFMGCESGEIELGMSTVPQVSIAMELRNFFPEDFQTFNLLSQLPTPLQEPQQQNKPSPSSSKPMVCSEHSSFHLNMNTSLYSYPHNSHLPTEQAFPTPENVDDAIANAIIAVLSSPTYASSSLPGTGQENSNLGQPRTRGQLSAFKEFNGSSKPSSQVFKAPSSSSLCRDNKMKRVVSFYRVLNMRRLQDQQLQRLSRPPITQSHHVLKERKRRGKINEYFQALRSLLPPGTKKNKDTVLRTSKDYMNSLRDQVSQLIRREQLLESQLSSIKANIYNDAQHANNAEGFSSEERVHVRLTPIVESSSDQEQRIMGLEVSVRADGMSFLDLVSRLLGFLKGVQEVRLASMGANHCQTVLAFSNEEQQQGQLQQQQQQQQQQHSINRVALRLIVDEGSDWDQSTFVEAVRRVIADRLACP